MFETFIKSLIILAVAYFILRILLPYEPGGEKELKNKWISKGIAILNVILSLVFIGAGLVVWFFIVVVVIGKLLVILGFPGWLGLSLLAIAYFGPIVWMWNGGRFPNSPNPHDYGCGDRRPPGYDGP